MVKNKQWLNLGVVLSIYHHYQNMEPEIMLNVVWDASWHLSNSEKLFKIFLYLQTKLEIVNYNWVGAKQQAKI